MQLIDEIEQDVAINGESFRGPLLREAWPRIKAALLSGEEMACVLEDDPDEHGQGSEHYAPECRACQALVDFRAATEGTPAAEIGRAS